MAAMTMTMTDGRPPLGGGEEAHVPGEEVHGDGIPSVEDSGIVRLANEFGCELVSSQDAEALWKTMEPSLATHGVAESSGLHPNPKDLFQSDFGAKTLRKLSLSTVSPSSGWLFHSPVDVSWVSELGGNLFDPAEMQKPIDALEKHRDELELPKVYSLPSLFQSAEQGSSFRQRLIECLKEQIDPQKMELEGVDLLARPGARPFFEQLGHRLHALLAQYELYPNLVSGSKGLEPVAAYIVGYSYLKDEQNVVEHMGLGSFIGHPTHVDDCHLTINCCLGEEFFGGELYFAGARSTIPSSIACGQVEQFPGSCLIHEGSAAHGAKPITRGQRLNLIVWFNRQDSFDRFVLLPSDIKLRIAESLDTPRDVARFSRTARELSQLVGNSRSVWPSVLCGVLQHIPLELPCSSIKLGRLWDAKKNTRFAMEQIAAYPFLNDWSPQTHKLNQHIENDNRYITEHLDWYYSRLKAGGYDTRETPLQLDEPDAVPEQYDIVKLRPVYETLTRLYKTLSKFHSRMLPYTQECLKQYDLVGTTLLMCRLITNLIATVPAYQSFCIFCAKVNPEYIPHYKARSHDPSWSLTLNNQFSVPQGRIQRVYPPFVNEYNNGPGIRGWDVLHLHQLQVVFDNLTEAIDNGKKYIEYRVVVRIQHSVRGSNLLRGSNTGRYVNEGNITQHKVGILNQDQQHHLFLFTHVLLIAKDLPFPSPDEYNYSCQGQIELDHCSLINTADTANLRHAFELRIPGNFWNQTFLFSCKDDREKNDWMHDIRGG